MLFSENVFIVEGKTEKILLPEIYSIIRISTLAKDKTCMVEAGGSDSIYQMMQMLQNVGFQPRAIVDLDYIFKKH